MIKAKVVIYDGNKRIISTEFPVIDTGFLVIEGKRIKINEVNLPSHKYEACFVKGNNSRLYP
jgi:hypothetical protein